jgi:hypothetical protein
MAAISLNWLAVGVATLAKFFLGWIWFGPLFGKLWRQLVGMSEARMKAIIGKAIVYDLVTTFILSTVLAYVVRYAGATFWAQGAVIGFLCWLGFIGSTTFAATLYEQRPLKFWFLTNSYHAIALAVMGAILVVWP